MYKALFFSASIDLYREAQNKGLVGAEPLHRKRSLEEDDEESTKQIRVGATQTN